MIKDFEPRLYQESILNTAVSHNTLVVLPTGMGKTNVFLMLAAQRLKMYPDSKIFLIGPTRPLIEQYREVFLKHFDIDEKKLVVFTGQISPAKREVLWQDAQIIFSTPQGLENDIISGRIKLDEISLLGIDEAHRAVGNYSYVWIAKQYNKKARRPRIIGMTASPGSDSEKITEVCRNLFIEEIEVRTEQDPDVAPYIQEVDVDWIKLDLPDEIKQIKDLLQRAFKNKIDQIKGLGVVKNIPYMSKKELLLLQGRLHGELARGNKDFRTLKTISVLAEIMKLYHAIELIETQGVEPLRNYLERLQEEAKNTKVKAVQNLMNDYDVKTALGRAQLLVKEKIDHPKFIELSRILKEQFEKDKTSKTIIFTQYRDTATKVKLELEQNPDITCQLFFGQSKKGETGLSQKEQKAMLQKFGSAEFNTLIATSIGEEGLDIPKVDLVVFYEPIPSAIRQIQRRGRTGRGEKGRVVILLTKDTRDEAYRWIAQNKEKKMHKILQTIKHSIKLEKLEKQQPLENYTKEEKVKIYADIREKSSGVIKELVDNEVEVGLKTLEIGDYICSERVAVEIKNVEDFVNSIVDGRLLSQAKRLKDNYPRPILIIEGEEDIFSVRKVHPNAIRGMMATIAIDFAIPILRTANYKETTAMLISIAKREQEKKGKGFSLHFDGKPLTLKDKQEYVISSLPGIENKLAKNLLKTLGSVKNVINATEEDLIKADLIGQKKAKEIRKVVDEKYEESSDNLQ